MSKKKINFKVLHVITSLSSGGAEKLVLDLSLLYAQQGIRTDVLVLSGRKTPFLERLSKNPRIRIYTPDNLNNVYDPRHIIRIGKLFRYYDIVHTHLFPAFYWVGLAALLYKSPALVYTEHNTNNRRRRHWFLKYFDRLIYRRYKAVITISDAVEKNLKDHLPASYHGVLHKVYNGINLNEILNAEALPKESIGVPAKATMILQVASFTPQKNQRFLIDSLQFLPDNHHLVLVGEGPEILSCQSHTEDLGLSKRVHFLGIRGDVPRLLKTADVVVLSSHFEGLSLASVEGLASGAPFLASDVPGLKEVVDGAGILFENTDPVLLAELINEVNQNKTLRNEVIERSIKRAQKFDIKNMVQQYLELYFKHL